MTKLVNFSEKTSKLVPPLKAVFGIDPASGRTGWSLLVVDGNQTLHVVRTGVIKPSDKLEQNQQLFHIYSEIFQVLSDVVGFLYENGIELIGYSVEVPAVLLGGRQRISRDIVQIQAIGAIRAAMGGSVYKEIIVRPNQVHSQAGANSTNYFKQIRADLKEKGYKSEKIQAEVKKIKKNMVKEWVVKNCILYNSMKTFDESDAIIIAIIGYHALTNTKKRRTKC